ncbi:MAG: VacB/RNase II family 3'-5' exoribonuclease, partial [Gammaproteobacteria bacterium]
MGRIPSKDEVLQWIADNPGLSAKRDIAKAFGIRGAERIELKRLLKELEDDGALERRRKSYRDAADLPPVAVLVILAPDAHGDQFARALEWQGEGPEPRILFQPRRSDAPVAEGDRILAKLNPVKGDGHQYEARLIRKIGTNPIRIVGIFRKTTEGGRIVAIDKGSDKEWLVASDATQGARDGELVEAELAGPKARLGLPKARVIDRLGDPSAPKAVSLIAIHQHGIPDQFPDAVIAEADAMAAASLVAREDLRDLPFLTIDPADARDRDDAVLAQPDENATNAGGFIVWVAIADVAHYVTPQSALDREARNRGNSTYFPDRVVPMLPDRLSGDLCSLHEHVDRAVLAVRMVVDSHGNKLSHRFTRALIRSRGALAYEEVQAARDGAPNDRTAPLLDGVIAPLYAAYAALVKARAARQPLDLDLPERRIELTADGRVKSVAFKERLDAHRLIEEFMILANVAAAETLEKAGSQLIYRCHDEPSLEKMRAVGEVLASIGIKLPQDGALRPVLFNRILAMIKGSENETLINEVVLRTQAQAEYVAENYGHFGLNLRRYAHFTSPIRRYADLIVHRGLIRALNAGKDGLPEGVTLDALREIGAQISAHERRAMAAERETTDRLIALFLAERVGESFKGRIA